MIKVSLYIKNEVKFKTCSPWRVYFISSINIFKTYKINVITIFSKKHCQQTCYKVLCEQFSSLKFHHFVSNVL